MKIAICDDNKEALHKNKQYVSDYLDKNGISAEIKVFSDPISLLDACEKETFSLYILDIIMPMMSGIDVGVHIRRLDCEALIIYITTASEFALKSFNANPIDYIIKPIKKEKIFKALDFAFSKTPAVPEKTFLVKTKQGLETIPYSSIICCEQKGHIVVFNLMGGKHVESVTLRIKFSEYVTPLLEDHHFFMPHKSFLVHLGHVEKILDFSFQMQQHILVPIIKSQIVNAKKAYMEYMFGKEENKWI